MSPFSEQTFTRSPPVGKACPWSFRMVKNQDDILDFAVFQE
jgi:hypothetical protein